jgi:hypothetical protein
MGVSINLISGLVSLPFPQLVSHDTVHQCRCEYSRATEPLTPQTGPSLKKKNDPEHTRGSPTKFLFSYLCSSRHQPIPFGSNPRPTNLFTTNLSVANGRDVSNRPDRNVWAIAHRVARRLDLLEKAASLFGDGQGTAD